MLEQRAILAPQTAGSIARGILEIDDGPAGQPSGDYLDYEKRLIDIVGPEASLVHAGRSRQDIASTLSRMNLRDDVLNAHQALAQARDSLLPLAAQHTRTIIPAYTHGVQAQPTTFAHYLLAWSSTFERQLQRLAAAYRRLNVSSLGVAALSTSSFPVDRALLAELLGFDGLLENAYDANHMAPVDCCLEYAAALSISAVQISQFAQDLHAQYAAPIPWLTLRPGELMGISSLMPQKRNPAALEQLRAQSGLLMAEMQGPFMLAHNVRTGMFDYRAYDPLPTTRPIVVFELLAKVIQGIVVDPEQSRAEVDADYSTVTEFADLLLQKAGVPFRVGHHFASALTDFGRAQKKPLRDITHADASALYRQLQGEDLPLDAAEFARCTDAEQMVFNRKGTGGPQLAEVDRMLATEQAAAAAALQWNRTQRQALHERHQHLIQRTRALAGRA